MLNGKDVVRWVGLVALMPLYAGCVSDTSRPNTLPRRSSTAMDNSSNASFASRSARVA
jgi:hypothetical protein